MRSSTRLHGDGFSYSIESFLLQANLPPPRYLPSSKHNTKEYVHSVILCNITYILSVPCTALISIFIALFHPSHKTRTTLVQSIWQIDWIGIILSLAATILLVFSLQSAGAATGWRSRTIITSLAVAGLCWVIFVVWQCTLARSPSFTTLPIFPSHLARKRVVVASYGYADHGGRGKSLRRVLIPITTVGTRS